MKLHRLEGGGSLIEGDSRQVLQKFTADRFDSVVSDPPYELGFMGKGWDASGIAFDVAFWREVLRVLKPGGHLLAFGGTRTYHRMACAIEDAGFEVRDSLHWHYGTGFPKSLNVLKEMRAKGMLCECNSEVRDVRKDVRDVEGVATTDDASDVLAKVQREEQDRCTSAVREPGSEWVDCDESRELRGEDDGGEEPGVEGRGHVPQRERELQGAALRAVSGRPAADGAARWVRARDGSPTRAAADASRGGASPRPRPEEQCTGKPAAVPEQSGAQAGRSCGSCGKVRAEFVAGLGTALKPGHEPVILARKPLIGTIAANIAAHGTGGLRIDESRIGTSGATTKEHHDHHKHTSLSTYGDGLNGGNKIDLGIGRWPANVLLDEQSAAELDAQTLELKSGGRLSGNEPSTRDGLDSFNRLGARVAWEPHGDSGGASRFFYVAKPSRAERDQGCDHLPAKTGGEATDRADDSAGTQNPRAGAGRNGGARNFHPTVKPVELMRYLVRLVTPPGGCVLDPFTGSGTTGMAARLEGLDFVGIEREPEYAAIAAARIAGAA